MTNVSVLDIDEPRGAAGVFRPQKYRTRSDQLIGSAYLLIALSCLVVLALAGVMSLATP